MARRRRRGRFNRIRPDMGWWIDAGYTNFVYNAAEIGGQYGGAVSTIQFADITDDDSLITRDNSDWFVKRVLFEAFPSLDTGNNTSAFDTKRLLTVAVGTVDNDKLAEWVVNQREDLFSPDGYELWARIFRMWQTPVYQPFAPKIVVGSAYTGALGTSGSSAETYAWRANMMDWGQSAIIDDISVSNAGLKPEQSLAIAFCGDRNMDINEPYRWENGDTVGLRFNLRVLLQKRRAA